MATILSMLLAALLLSACARMGQPDGGWYDEQPPRVIGAEPAENATNVKTKKLFINFNGKCVQMVFLLIESSIGNHSHNG